MPLDTAWSMTFAIGPVRLPAPSYCAVRERVIIRTPCAVRSSTAARGSAAEDEAVLARYSEAPGAMSWTISATLTPWVDGFGVQMSHGSPSWMQNSPAGLGTSPDAAAAVQLAPENESMMPILT